MRLERRHQPILGVRPFLLRMVRYALMSGAILFSSLLVGILGYHWIARLAWMDALLNASMILTGMGPVDKLETPLAKLFASGYALFSGVIFLSAVGVLLTPVYHRLLHHFHLDVDESAKRKPSG